MQFIDCLKKRKNIVCRESEGLNLAVCSINECETRKFTFIGLQKKYSGVNADRLLVLLQNEINSMLIVYRYTTKVKKYTDRKGQSQMHIHIIGKASMMSKYNPLDIKLDIATDDTEE